ncbi:hypothetical protein FRB99_006260 [Tulasnella sp. 403]|nr:hypothetical protein FRB99_006260 [Tulasnella sp. 403]
MLDEVASLYAYLLRPIPSLTALGLPVGILDILGTLRLALAVQQIKHGLRVRAAKDARKSVQANEKVKVEEDRVNGSVIGKRNSVAYRDDSAVSSIWCMLVIVYGGELFVSSFISQPPSFITSPTGPILLSLGHYIVNFLLTYAPGILPLQPSLGWELPLAAVDGFTRALLLCSIAPSTILGHSAGTISDSATALLMTTTLMANGGFFIVNAFSMLSPSGWQISTPPELLPNGWTSLDLLSAPLVTGLFATLTQAQTTWKSAAAYVQSPSGDEKPGNGALDVEQARALCAVVLMVLFGGRAIKNFGAPTIASPKKLKTQ